MREINDAVLAEVEAEQGSSFLPMLRSQSEAIDEFMAERFGEMTSAPLRGGHDAAGWASGEVAVDNARLNAGHLTPQR